MAEGLEEAEIAEGLEEAEIAEGLEEAEISEGLEEAEIAEGWVAARGTAGCRRCPRMASGRFWGRWMALPFR